MSWGKPEVIQFAPEHLNAFTPREVADLSGVDTASLIASGVAFSVILDGRIIGCGGIVQLWSGVGEAWTVFNEELGRYPIWMHKTTRRILNGAMDVLNLHRLQAVALRSSNRNCKWLSRLGFTSEGPLNAFGPNKEDYTRYAIVRK